MAVTSKEKGYSKRREQKIRRGDSKNSGMQKSEETGLSGQKSQVCVYMWQITENNDEQIQWCWRKMPWKPGLPGVRHCLRCMCLSNRQTGSVRTDVTGAGRHSSWKAATSEQCEIIKVGCQRWCAGEGAIQRRNRKTWWKLNILNINNQITYKKTPWITLQMVIPLSQATWLGMVALVLDTVGLKWKWDTPQITTISQCFTTQGDFAPQEIDIW